MTAKNEYKMETSIQLLGHFGLKLSSYILKFNNPACIASTSLYCKAVNQ